MKLIISSIAIVFFGFLYLVSSDGNDGIVPKICLGCICEAISNCSITKTCQGDVCGLFRITFPYWLDANNKTSQGAVQQDRLDYQNCVVEPQCAAKTVEGYMTKFQQDCNGDGFINCYDFAAIHLLGGYGCKGNLKPDYFDRFDTCIKKFQEIDVRSS